MCALYHCTMVLQQTTRRFTHFEGGGKAVEGGRLVKRKVRRVHAVLCARCTIVPCLSKTREMNTNTNSSFQTHVSRSRWIENWSVRCLTAGPSPHFNRRADALITRREEERPVGVQNLRILGGHRFQKRQSLEPHASPWISQRGGGGGGGSRRRR